MKKKILWSICMLILLFGMIIPITVHASPSRLTDHADLLTTDEEHQLISTLDEISLRQQMDIVIVTTPSLNGTSAAAFADDFYDQNGYGLDSENSGILLLISMAEREWYISTTGTAITTFTDAGLDYIGEKLLDSLSSGDYNQAFSTFANLCDHFITQANEKEPYDIGKMPKKSLPVFWLIPAMVAGLVISFFIGNIEKSQLKSVRFNDYAKDYTVKNSLQYTVRHDRFVNQIVTTRVINRDKNTSRGGSSVHRSSSGMSHGGRGGKF